MIVDKGRVKLVNYKLILMSDITKEVHASNKWRSQTICRMGYQIIVYQLFVFYKKMFVKLIFLQVTMNTTAKRLDKILILFHIEIHTDRTLYKRLR